MSRLLRVAALAVAVPAVGLALALPASAETPANGCTVGAIICANVQNNAISVLSFGATVNP